jgi:cell division protein FtsQ
LPTLKPSPRRRGLDARLSGAAPARVLAAAVLLGSCGAGLAYSQNPSRVLDAVGRAGGFEVRFVNLEGQKETSDSAIVAAIGLGPDVSLLSLDVTGVRERLESLPWVREATVRKVLPETLDVDIVEASAFARWRLEGEEVLIAADGTVLSDDVSWRFRDLPLVAGRGANTAVRQALSLLSAHPQMERRTVAAILVNERRWDLRLTDGSTLRLPETGASAALDRFARLESESDILAAGPVVVDLRLPDRTMVELDPSANPQLAPSAPPGPRPVEPVDPLARAIAEAAL